MSDEISKTERVPTAEAGLLRHWKIVLSLALIFIAGAVTGSVVTFKIVKQVVNARTNPDQWSGRILREYRDRLQLTPVQIERIKPRMMEAGRELKDTRSEFTQAYGQIFRRVHTEIYEELRPEQREMFRRIREEKMAKFRMRQGSQPNMMSRPNNPMNREKHRMIEEKLRRERMREQQGRNPGFDPKALPEK
ncbi:MAG: hypothetical protein ACPGVU_19590 [Limisphaerales bacterium]